MTREDHCFPLVFTRADQFDDIFSGDDIETARWFVKNDNRRIMDHGAANRYLLFHTRTELPDSLL